MNNKNQNNKNNNMSYYDKHYYANKKTFKKGYSSVSPQRSVERLERRLQKIQTENQIRRNAKFSSWIKNIHFVLGTPDVIKELEHPEVLLKVDIYGDKNVSEQKEYLNNKGYGDLEEYLFKGRLPNGKKKTNAWRKQEFEKMGLVFEKQTSYYYQGVNESIFTMIKEYGSKGLGINDLIFKNDDIPSYCHKSKPNLLEKL